MGLDSKITALAGLVLLALAAAAGAFSLQLSADAVHTSGTTASLYAYADQNAAFSVESEYTNARVEQKGDHAKIFLLAPDCLSGTETITVRATNGTATRTQTLSLAHTPRAACAPYIHTEPLQKSLQAPQTLLFSHSFDATHYAMDLDAGSACVPAKVGQTVTQRIKIANDGAATSAQLRALENDGTHTALSKEEVTLQQNELTDAVAYIRADAAGTHYINIQALRGGIVIGSATACINAQEDERAILTVPGETTARQCETTTIPAELFNIGTKTQTFILDGDFIAPVTATLSSSGRQTVPLLLDTSKLRLNQNVIAIRATGEGTTGTAYTVVNVASCQPSVSVELINPQADSLSWAVLVTNNQDTPLRNVTLRIDGIPSAWTQQSQSVDIPAHGQALVGASVTRTTDEAASPVITVLADGVPINQQAAPAISQRASVTGAVIGINLENPYTPGTILLLLVGVAILFMAGAAFYRAQA